MSRRSPAGGAADDGRGVGSGERVVTADALGALAADIFVGAGMSRAHAATVADVLVWADLRGMTTHGVSRIPWYAKLAEAGHLNPTPTMRRTMETVATVLIDADRAAGPIAMTTAMSAAVEKARDAGVGLALVRDTTHTAALGYYTLRGAEAGMAALVLAASTPMMAYHGARAAGVSTSPISIAVPGGARGPLVLDMATGVVSAGKLLEARRTGRAIPAGSALDARGDPTTDPATATIPLPLGGPKGSGLALMIECITSLVVGNAIIAETLEATAEGRRHRQNALALAIDVARFGDPDAFRHEVDRVVADLKALPRDSATVEILAPGERGHRTWEQRRRDGIPVPAAVAEELAAVARRLGVTARPFSSS